MPVDPAKAHLVRVNIVERAGWGAAAPTRSEPLTLPVKSLVVYYDSDINPCHGPEQCVKAVQELQRRHMEQGLPDVAYNFLVGGDGTIYEGTGWYNKSWKLGEKYAKQDGTSYDFAYIGRFTEDKAPYPDMSSAAIKLVNQAVLNDRMDPAFAFYEDVKGSEIFKTNILDV